MALNLSLSHETSSDEQSVKIKALSPVSGQKSSKSTYNKTNSSDCKFGSSDLHSFLRCNKFVSHHKERVDQARMLKFCLHCLSSKHMQQDCIANKGGLTFKCLGCRKNDHVSPMCPTPSFAMTSGKIRSS